MLLIKFDAIFSFKWLETTRTNTTFLSSKKELERIGYIPAISLK